MAEKLLAADFPSFRHLRVLEAVARHENLSRAAVEANMSQPAATQAVMKIEAWVGVKLFQRSWTGTFMTREGQIFLVRVRRLFEQVEASLLEELFGGAARDTARTVLSRLKASHVNVLNAVSGSFSFEDAALSLGLSRTNVQRTARELERILGHALYERTSSGLVANPAARRLAIALPRACRELPEGIEEIALLAGRMKSRLFIGTQRLVCASLLASTINRVLGIYPETQVKIIEGSYRQLLHELRSGRIDFMFGALERPEGLVEVLEEPLIHEPYCVACRQGHPLLARPRVSLHDLGQLGWVLPGNDSQRSRAFEQLFRKASHPPTSRITVSAIATQISILASSDRVTLLPRFELTMEPQFSGLSALAVHMRIARAPDGLTVRANWVANPVQELFRGELQGQIRKLGLTFRSARPKLVRREIGPRAA